MSACKWSIVSSNSFSFRFSSCCASSNLRWNRCVHIHKNSSITEMAHGQIMSCYNEPYTQTFLWIIQDRISKCCNARVLAAVKKKNSLLCCCSCYRKLFNHATNFLGSVVTFINASFYVCYKNGWKAFYNKELTSNFMGNLLTGLIIKCWHTIWMIPHKLKCS